jgi:hypothetical protein
MMNKCWECDKADVPLHNHHPVPKSRGGKKTIPLCEECHSKAHHRDKNMNTSALTKEGQLKRIKANKRYSQKAPWGYRFEGDDIVEEPKEQEQIKLTIKLRKQRPKLAWREIAEEVFKAGYRNRDARKLTSDNLRIMLTGYYKRQELLKS